jgi:hypothetical protein
VDFGGVRKGGVAFDAEFSGQGKEVDFAKRTGPVEAEFQGGKDVDFGAARGSAAFDAEFAGGSKEVDFAAKRVGPVEAEFVNEGKNVDFGAARGGGGAFEADFVKKNDGDERDMNNMRSGAKVSEMVRPGGGADLDFGGARKGMMMNDARSGGEEVPPATNMDWGARKGPLDAAPVRRPQAARDFGAARQTGGGGMSNSTDGPADSAPMGPGARPNGMGGERSPEANGGPPDAPAGRDWGRARRTQPLPTRGRDGHGRKDSGEVRGVTNQMERVRLNGDARSTPAQNGNAARNDSSDGDWTTVRAAPRPSRGRGGPAVHGRGGGGWPARMVPASASKSAGGVAAGKESSPAAVPAVESAATVTE